MGREEESCLYEMGETRKARPFVGKLGGRCAARGKKTLNMIPESSGSLPSGHGGGEEGKVSHKNRDGGKKKMMESATGNARGRKETVFLCSSDTVGNKKKEEKKKKTNIKHGK